ncbi:helix-turn-helix domain-containing protein [Rapidithrix thailandica]|uniref:Helix-turn-helix domain-containing protein n=1 Tax=Rapidithrix thailandica TaxID=413964 RepID=A0AAW9SAF2_9BACT
MERTVTENSEKKILEVFKSFFGSIVREVVRDEISKQNFKQEEKEEKDELLTIEQACEFLDVSRTTIVQWRKKGILTWIRRGRRVYFKKSDLMNHQLPPYPHRSP